MYAGYVISTYNSEMPASLRELYQNIATELYQQGFLQGIDMITLHKEVSEMAHNRTKLATATAKMINNINK